MSVFASSAIEEYWWLLFIVLVPLTIWMRKVLEKFDGRG